MTDVGLSRKREPFVGELAQKRKARKLEESFNKLLHSVFDVVSFIGVLHTFCVANFEE